MPTSTNVTAVFLSADLQKGAPALEKSPPCFSAQGKVSLGNFRLGCGVVFRLGGFLMNSVEAKESP